MKQGHMHSLRELPTLNKESFSGLRQLLDDTNNHLLALQALGVRVNYWDTFIIYLLTTKLDSVTKGEWENAQSVMIGDITLSDFTNFLERQCSYLERKMTDKPFPQPSGSQIVNQDFQTLMGHSVTCTAIPQTPSQVDYNKDTRTLETNLVTIIPPIKEETMNETNPEDTTLRQLGESHSGTLSDSSRVIIRDFCAGDLLTGADFIPRGWAANRAEPSNRDERSETEVEVGSERVAGTLRLCWDAQQEELCCLVGSLSGLRATERTILSDTSDIRSTRFGRSCFVDGISN